MKTIVYLTGNIENGKCYIGIHDVEDPNKWDGYYGNGIYRTKGNTVKNNKELFPRAIRKYGYDAFRRFTIKVCDSREEAMELERQLVDLNFISRDDTYNMVVGGDTPPVTKKEVYQYTLTGEYVRSFESIREAANHLEIPESCIGRAVLDRGISKGFYWTDVRVDHLDVLSQRTTIQNVPIYLYNPSDGGLIHEFPSMSSTATFLDVRLSSVQKALRSGSRVGGYIPSKVKYDKYPVKHVVRKRVNDKVYQYDLQGCFIAEYDNTRAACNHLGLKTNKISAAIRQLTKFGGFYWSWEKQDCIHVPKEQVVRKIGRYDKEGNLLEVFNTVRECRKQYSNCSKVLQGLAAHCKGFYFRYIE